MHILMYVLFVPLYLLLWWSFAQVQAACNTVVILLSRRQRTVLAGREPLAKPETSEEVKALLENPEPWDEISLLNLKSSCLHTLLVLFLMLFAGITFRYYLPGFWPWILLLLFFPVAIPFGLMVMQFNDYRKNRGKSRFKWKNEQDLVQEGQKNADHYNDWLKMAKGIRPAEVVRLVVILALIAASVTLAFTFVILPNRELVDSDPHAEKIFRLDNAFVVTPADSGNGSVPRVTVTDEFIRIGRDPKDPWKLQGSVYVRMENTDSRPVMAYAKKIIFTDKDGETLAEKSVHGTLNLNPGAYGYLSCTIMDAETKAPVNAIEGYRIEYAVERVSDPFPDPAAGEARISSGKSRIYFTLRNPTEDILFSPDFTYAVRDGEGRLLYTSDDSMRYMFGIDPGSKVIFVRTIPNALSELLKDAPGPYSVDVLIKTESN